MTRKVGKGRISLLGAWLDKPGMTNVAEWACREAGVPLPWGRLPEGIEVSCRQAADRRLYVVCNPELDLAEVRAACKRYNLAGLEELIAEVS